MATKQKAAKQKGTKREREKKTLAITTGTTGQFCRLLFFTVFVCLSVCLSVCSTTPPRQISPSPWYHHRHHHGRSWTRIIS
jgi:hypothetical protein